MLARRTLASTCRRQFLLRSFATENNPTAQECDIVIVGGGPAGLALASALGSSESVRESLRVTLVEAGDLSKVQNWSPAPGTFSNRVSSLTNASHSLLREIGAWDYVEEGRTCPVEDMQVWDGISDARISFSASDSPVASNQLSYLTENLNLQRGLLRHLSTIPEVQLLDNVRVESIQKEDRGANGWPLVHLSNGQILRTRLLIGADGFNSPVRKYAGIGSYGWAYDTHAVVATMNHAPRSALQIPNTTAYQRFLPTGPIAFLPLSPTVSSLVWSTKPSIAAALKSVDSSVLASMINAAFRLPEVSLRYLHNLILEREKSGTPINLLQLQEEIAWREKSHGINERSAYSSVSTSDTGVPSAEAEYIPPVVTSMQPGTIASFPLKHTHAESYIGEGNGARTALLGDAAHTVHPLAGQGLNLGLGDVGALARCIEDTLTSGGDIGSRTALMAYTRDRYFENHKMLSAVDKLHKLYASTAEPVVWARSVGLEVLNELDTVKAAMMLSAGSGARVSSQPGFAPGLAARGVEVLNEAVSGARFVGQSLAGVVGMGIQEVGKAISKARS